MKRHSRQSCARGKKEAPEQAMQAAAATAGKAMDRGEFSGRCVCKEERAGSPPPGGTRAAGGLAWPNTAECAWADTVERCVVDQQRAAKKEGGGGRGVAARPLRWCCSRAVLL